MTAWSIVTGVDAGMAAVQAQRRADLELLMALRGTQLDQGEQITRQGERIARLEARVERGFAEVQSGLEVITALIGRLLPGENS